MTRREEKQLKVYVPEALKEAFKAYAADKHVSMNQLIEEYMSRCVHKE